MAGAVAQLSAQREAGTRESARAHTAQLAQLEEAAHDAALRRAARANETLQRVGERHVAAVARHAAQVNPDPNPSPTPTPSPSPTLALTLNPTPTPNPNPNQRARLREEAAAREARLA